MAARVRLSRVVVLLCAVLVSVYAADRLQVHLIPHSHDDVGWLKTVDQYYYGSRNEIQHAGVQYILDTAIQALQNDPSRKFIYVEMAFFTRWWNEQTDQKKEIVRQLVKNGQLEFINGGWCMNDEASTYYTDIIDQLTLGHAFLLQEFNVIPKIGWHIDPFGHSNAQASIFAQMGFDVFLISRIDYQDRENRRKNKEHQFIWKSSQSLGASADIFSHITFDGYGNPDHFCFDQQCNDDDPMMDDPDLSDFNVKQMTDLFASEIREHADTYKLNHILVTMGGDFNYENAEMNFKNMDKLLKYMKTGHYDMDVFYSTPSQYFEAINKVNATWNTKQDDFFPYADGPHAYWTGYFTSRPTLKGYVRELSSLMHSADNLFSTGVVMGADRQAVGICVDELRETLDPLHAAMGIAQHHDAVSGTEKQHVANDYAQRLHKGQTATQESFATVVSALVSPKVDERPNFAFCELANVSICAETHALAEGKTIALVIYNPLAQPRSGLARIPVPIDTLSVAESGGLVVSHAAVFDTLSSDLQLSVTAQPHTLVFEYTDIPPLGFKTYFIKPAEKPAANRLTATQVALPAQEDISITIGTTSISFCAETGLLKSFSNGQSTDIVQTIEYYKSSPGTEDDEQASGAYIFRPIEQQSSLYATSPQLSVIHADFYAEVRQVYENSVTQVFRLYSTLPGAVEIEWTVGHINVSDGVGKEIISKFQTPLNNAGVFSTDSNGLEMVQRVRNVRPTWEYKIVEETSGNYYPINSAIYLQDKDSKQRLTIVTDRAQGGGSIKDGELEIMIHRRTTKDDSRGVDEPINELGEDGKGLISRGRFLFTIGHGDQISSDPILNQRNLESILANPSTLLYSTSIAQSQSNFQLSYSPLAGPLPPHVFIQTLQSLPKKGVLLRLQHKYGVGESPKFSSAVNLDLGSLFKNIHLKSVEEYTLNANQRRVDSKRMSWNYEGSNGEPLKTGYNELNGYKKALLGYKQSYQVELQPLEIRTFIVTFSKAPLSSC